MNRRLAWMLAGVAVIGAVVAVIALRGGDAPKAAAPATTAAGSGVGTGAGSTARATPERTRAFPTRTPPPPGPIARPPGDPEPTPSSTGASFDDEAVDAAWAPTTERTLVRRLSPSVEAAGATITGVECRTRTCKITVDAGTTDALGAAIARLEEDAGLAGVAQEMVVSVPVATGARVQLGVLATFER